MTVRSQTRPAPHPDAHARVINTTANPSYPTYANAEKNTSGMLNVAAIPLMPPMVARPRYAWRCSSCRRILMRHEMPLAIIAALVGRIEIKCHCNALNGVE